MQKNTAEQLKQAPLTPTGLYRTAGWLSLLMLALIPIQIVLFAIYPPPDSAEGFLMLYQQNKLLGLTSLDFLYLLNSVILIFIYLALFFRLFRAFPSLSATALALGLVGIACYFPSNPAFEMLALSGKYAAASADSQTILLAAGEALMAGYTGTAFVVYYVLNAIALILYAAAMLKSARESKKIAWFGVAAGILMLVPSSAGAPGMIFSLASLVPWVPFLILLAKDLLGNAP